MELQRWLLLSENSLIVCLLFENILLQITSRVLVIYISWLVMADTEEEHQEKGLREDNEVGPDNLSGDFN